MKSIKYGLHSTLGFIALSVPTYSYAQDDASTDTVGDIIVTGTKTSAGERAQDASISVSVVSGKTIDNEAIRDLTELGYRTPNVRLQPTGLNPGHGSYAMRGIGTNTSTPSDEPVVVTVLDGMVMGTALGAVLPTFDVEAVEIYRGPQGVLFGKNSTGGVVNVRSRRPTGITGLKLRQTLGSHGRFGAAIAAEAPLVEDVVAGRIAIMYDRQGGYFKDLDFPGKRAGGAAKTWTVRPSLSITPNDQLDITLIGEFYDYKGDGGVFRNLSDDTYATSVFEVPGCVERGICRNARSDGEQDSQHIIGEINYDLGFGKLTSITAYRELSVANHNVDADATAAPIFTFAYMTFDQDQFSEELRLAGSTADDKLSFVTGFYYFDQNWQATEGRVIFGSDRRGGASTLDNTQVAVFGQLSFAVTPELSLIAGGRYTHEKKSMDLLPMTSNNCLTPVVCDYLFTDLKFSSNNFSPKLGFEWQASPDALLFGSFTRGSRAGGYNSRYAYTSVAPSPYRDEKVDAYELGVKSDWFDRKLRVNFSVFHNEFSDLQRTILKSDSTQDVVNAAEVEIDGAELETSIVPTAGLRIDFSAGYTDARYKSFIDPRVTPEMVKTLKLERAPKWTLGAGVTHSLEMSDWGRFTTSVNYNYTGKYIASTLNELDFYVPSLHLIDASVALEVRDHMKISVFGKNLKDEIYGPITAVVMPLLLTQTVSPPRTFGVQLDFDF